MATKKNQIVIEAGSSGSGDSFSVGRGLFYSVLVFGGLLFAGKVFGDAAKNNTSGSIQNDENARLATRLFNILKGGGALDWYYRVDYQYILQVVDVAKEIKDWSAVQRAYKNLYNDDITTILNKNLSASDYSRFLNALSIKGAPTNGSGTTKIEPANTGLTIGKSIVFLNNAFKISFYKSLADYPSKPYLTFQAGTNFTSAGFLYYGAQRITYIGSSVSMVLYQIAMINGTKVWVREADIKGYTS